MKEGAIYVYYDPVGLRCVYVGSVQDGDIMRRHYVHLRERKGLLGLWLRQVNGVAPVLIERVPFENVDELFACENQWMDRLETLVENGGLNQVHAGGPDHARMGHLGGLKGGHRRHELHPELVVEMRNKATFDDRARGGRNCKGIRKIFKDPIAKSIAATKASAAATAVKDPDGKSTFARRGGHRMHELHPEHARNLGLIYGAKASHEDKVRAGNIAGHKRWHVARNRPNPACPLCRNVDFFDIWEGQVDAR